jgi:hypothetical protein
MEKRGIEFVADEAKELIELTTLGETENFYIL